MYHRKRFPASNPCVALQDGLFFRDYEAESFRANGFYTYDDCYRFALKSGLQEKRAANILDAYRRNHPAMHTLIDSSFLRDEVKAAYRKYYLDRLGKLNYSFAKRI